MSIQQKIRPPQIMIALYLIAGVCQALLKPARMIGPEFFWLGWALAIGGFSFMWWARQTFVNRKTPVRHSETPTSLVKTGPFKFTRNPMYAGGLTMFAGIGVLAGTWPFLSVPIVMFAIIRLAYIPWEEKLMRELFKEEYVQYCRSTRRWL